MTTLRMSDLPALFDRMRACGDEHPAASFVATSASACEIWCDYMEALARIKERGTFAAKQAAHIEHFLGLIGGTA